MVTLKGEPNSAQWLPKWHTGGHALLYVGVQRKEETGDMPHYAEQGRQGNESWRRMSPPLYWQGWLFVKTHLKPCKNPYYLAEIRFFPWQFRQIHEICNWKLFNALGFCAVHGSSWQTENNETAISRPDMIATKKQGHLAAKERKALAFTLK